MRVNLLGAGLFAFFGLAVPLWAADPVIVHEWGTFTCLQDENGKAIGGINVDDEPVPGFVHGVGGPAVLYAPLGLSSSFDSGKGWLCGDPAVTMRLETPILYLYPPKGKAPESVPPLTVHVDFQGGVLSQFFPQAKVNGLAMNGDYPFLEGPLTGKTTTGLTWKNIRLGPSGFAAPSGDRFYDGHPEWRGAVPETDSKVWTTPREVAAPLLEIWSSVNPGPVAGGTRHDIVETERFLFYRGVGHLDSPIFLRQDGNGDLRLGTSANVDEVTWIDFRVLCWLVDIRPDGTCAFRFVHVNRGFGSFIVPHMLPQSPSFDERDFSVANLPLLKTSMQDALVKEGLYPDEASAMLRTWELSYFKSPGLRFFYIVPRAWLDKVLPMTITGAPTQVTRVMIGRIELVSDQERAVLARLAAGPCPDLAAVKQAALDAMQKGNLSEAEKEAFYTGEKPLSALGINLPPLVQDYLSLGRFRDTLIVHEQQKHPSAALAQFIKENNLVPGEINVGPVSR